MGLGKIFIVIVVIFINFYDGRFFFIERVKKNLLKKEYNVNDDFMKFGGNNISEKVDGLSKDVFRCSE